MNNERPAGASDVEWPPGDSVIPSPADLARALHSGFEPQALLLVEGPSDKAAVETLAERRGRNLSMEGVSVLPIGGASSAKHFLQLLGPRGYDLRLGGLCDVGEEGDFRLGLEQAGLGAELNRDEMERIGFFVCVADLEDELIRSLGSDVVEEIVGREGELASFRTFQNQPAWRGRPQHDQLRRFIGTRSGRKLRYGKLLVDALDLGFVPQPLDGALAGV